MDMQSMKYKHKQTTALDKYKFINNLLNKILNKILNKLPLTL